MLEGAEISPTIWQLFYQLYERTYAKRNGTRGYLTRTFFNQIASSMPEQIAMAVAYQNEIPVACALYFFDAETLYGRYWGSAGEFSYLHFELCYYSGIEFAIAKGLQRYDAGAQGEHKIIRGFEPLTTHSLHWIQHPQFHGAIARFLQSEQASVTTAPAAGPGDIALPQNRLVTIRQYFPSRARAPWWAGYRRAAAVQ